MFAELFNFIAGITLFLFTIHYVFYIIQTLSINAVATTDPNTNQNRIATSKQSESAVVKTTRSIAMQSEDAKYIKK